MKHTRYEKGQALIMIVLAIFGLLGLTALTIDGGNAYSDRRHAQNAADAAAMAAALTKVRAGDWHAAGLARAADNDYDNNGDTNIVQVVSPPVSGQYAGNPDYIQVLIESHVDTYFAGILGFHQMTNRVQAVSKTKLSGIGPLFDGEALVALSPDDSPAFSTCGNPNVIVENSGIFVNSASECAMQAGGNVTIDVDTGVSVANQNNPFCTNGNVNFDDPLAGGAEQVDYPPIINLPAPSIECSEGGSFDEDTNTFQPGTYNSITIPPSASVNFAPGNYCINGDVTIKGDVTANYVSFRLNSGDFDVSSSANFTADHMIVYSTGDSDGMHFNGTGDITATNTTFYMESGDVFWNGNSTVTMTAPTSGPNANMLIYLPYGNEAILRINGNAGSLVQGTILGVSAHVEVTGNAGAEAIKSQIVGYTVEACGNGDLTIDYDPGDNFEQQEPAKIELTE